MIKFLLVFLVTFIIIKITSIKFNKNLLEKDLVIGEKIILFGKRNFILDLPIILGLSFQTYFIIKYFQTLNSMNFILFLMILFEIFFICLFIMYATFQLVLTNKRIIIFFPNNILYKLKNFIVSSSFKKSVWYKDIKEKKDLGWIQITLINNEWFRISNFKNIKELFEKIKTIEEKQNDN